MMLRMYMNIWMMLRHALPTLTWQPTQDQPLELVVLQRGLGQTIGTGSNGSENQWIGVRVEG